MKAENAQNGQFIFKLCLETRKMIQPEEKNLKNKMFPI